MQYNRRLWAQIQSMILSRLFSLVVVTMRSGNDTNHTTVNGWYFETTGRCHNHSDRAIRIKSYVPVKRRQAVSVLTTPLPIKDQRNVTCPLRLVDEWLPASDFRIGPRPQVPDGITPYQFGKWHE